MHLSIAARSSPLSRAQVKEVLHELQKHHPEALFSVTWVESNGDIDLKTSLRSLGKTDFFTKEVDQLLLNHTCRVAIHSAKDLPDPLAKGLAVAVLTKSIDSRDSLVMREGERLEAINAPVIATSSARREEAVKQLREDVSFIDLRGTIATRLEKLKTGEADGVVVAEAALIRLGLTHLNRIFLPGETVEGQGQLAIVIRESDAEMKQLFQCI